VPYVRSIGHLSDEDHMGGDTLIGSLPSVPLSLSYQAWTGDDKSPYVPTDDAPLGSTAVSSACSALSFGPGLVSNFK
jgi:hypothetical protein